MLPLVCGSVMLAKVLGKTEWSANTRIDDKQNHEKQVIESNKVEGAALSRKIWTSTMKLKPFCLL